MIRLKGYFLSREVKPETGSLTKKIPQLWPKDCWPAKAVKFRLRAVC